MAHTTSATTQTTAQGVALVNTNCGCTLAFHSLAAASEWLAKEGQPGDELTEFNAELAYDGLTAVASEQHYANVRYALAHNAA